MTRLAYLCVDAGVPVFGSKGGSVHVQEVVRSMRRLGAQVTVVAARLGGPAPSDLCDLPLRLLPPLPPGDAAARERAALDAGEQARALLEAEGPFDLVYERYSLWSAAGMEYAAAAGIPGVLEVNAPLIEEQRRYRTLVDPDAAARMARRAFAAAAVLIAVSDEVAAYLRRYPAARGRVRVVPNGVDPHRFHPDAVPISPASPGVFTAGFVGTLKPWHGLPVLVEAFQALHRADPATRLLIVGDGPARAALAADLARRGLDEAARLVGSVPPAEVPRWLASMDVAVAPYPSGRFYFSPLKVVEYMAAGLPVVASRIGQLRGVIQDDVTGVLAPPGDPWALALTLALLRADPARRARLGAAARAAAFAHHTWDAAVRRILDLAFEQGARRPAASAVGT